MTGGVMPAITEDPEAVLVVHAEVEEGTLPWESKAITFDVTLDYSNPHYNAVHIPDTDIVFEDDLANIEYVLKLESAVDVSGQDVKSKMNLRFHQNGEQVIAPPNPQTATVDIVLSTTHKKAVSTKRKVDVLIPELSGTTSIMPDTEKTLVIFDPKDHQHHT